MIYDSLGKISITEGFERVQRIFATTEHFPSRRFNYPLLPFGKLPLPQQALVQSILRDQDLSHMLKLNHDFSQPIKEKQENFELHSQEIVISYAQHQHLEADRTPTIFDVLNLIDDQLSKLSNRTERLDRQIENGNTSSSRSAKLNILVAVLTLMATVTNILLTWWHSR